MLQPRQLEEVSARYAGPISEVREFLSKAGLCPGSAQALHEAAERVRMDRAFRRDLSSHLWAVIDGEDGRISHADLLGVLAVAAAGSRLAAEADEEDAHQLLRFAMETRRSLGGSDAPGREPVALPVAKAGRSRRLAWMAAASCLALLVAGLSIYRISRGMAMATDSAAISSTGTSHGGNPRQSSSGLPQDRAGRTAPTQAASSSDPDLGEAGHAPGSRTIPQRTIAERRLPVPFSRSEKMASGGLETARSGPPAVADKRFPASHEDRRNPVGVDPKPAVAAASLPPVPAASSMLLPPHTSLPAVAPVVIPRGTAAPHAAMKPVAASTLSQRLGAGALPAYALATDDPGVRFPRLLRRRTAAESAASLDGDAGLVAELDSGSTPMMPGSGGKAHASSSHEGTVRPASLGMMAGNVVYSPSPVYPAAASAAHVQGEVRIQAEVGRDGNVMGARVVSGPPLLRDAALDAVQRWRYRPYLSGGKPVPMSATAVVDFELP